MSVLTIRPNACLHRGVSVTTDPVVSGTDSYQCIDEETLNETDYLYINCSVSGLSDYFEFDFPDHTTESDTINKVTLKLYAKKVQTGSAGATIDFSIKIGSTKYHGGGSAENLTTTTTLYSREFTTNPATSSAWSWADIDALIASIEFVGVRVDKNNYANPTCFQMWIEITHGESGGQTLTLDLSDTVNISDARVKAIGLAKADTVLLNDSLARHLGKTLVDGIAIADQIRKAISKILLDTAYFSDTFVTFAITANTYKSMVMAVQRVRQVCGQLTKRVREVTSRARIREIVCTPVHLKKEENMELLVFDPKQNWEEYYVAFNFIRDITPGTTVRTATVIVTDADGVIVTDTLTIVAEQLIVGAKVFVWVRAGSEQIYKFTCRIVMSNGEKFEQDAELEVAEV